jgi:drug/metabolite transporter (DMT)-like permease
MFNYLLIVVMWASLALAFPLAKFVLACAPPAFVIGFRMVLAGLVLLTYCLVTRQFKQRLTGADWLGFAKVGLFNIYLAFVPEFWSLQYIDSLKVNLMYSSTPFWAAIMSWFIVGERLPRYKWLAMLIGFLGLIPLFITESGTEALCKTLFTISIPELVLLGAIVSAAYAWFEIKKLLDRGYAVPLVNGMGMLFGGLMSFAHHLATYSGTNAIFPVSNAPLFLVLIAGLILVTNVIFYNLYAYLLRSTPFTFLSFTGFLSPVFGTIYGMIFFGEPFKILYLIGFMLTVAGLALFTRAKAPKQPWLQE